MANAKFIIFPYLGESHEETKISSIKVRASLVSDTEIVFPTLDAPSDYSYKTRRSIRLEYLALVTDFVEDEDSGKEEEQLVEQTVQIEALSGFDLDTKVNKIDNLGNFEFYQKMKDKNAAKFVRRLKKITMITLKQAQAAGRNFGLNTEPTSKDNAGDMSNFSLTGRERAPVEVTDEERETLETEKRRVAKKFNKTGIVEKTYTIPQLLNEFAIEEDDKKKILDRIRVSLGELLTRY